MNKQFLNDNFMLPNETAINLFHNFAKDEPIIDYHCHLQPKEMVENKNYRNITHIWLGGDHYKWRLMRANGVDEKFITGDGEDFDKFLAFAKTLDKAAGNPIFEWTHLELRRYFGIDEVLSESTAESIWERCNQLINTDAFRPRDLLANMNVKVVCTTDDPIDSLEYHDQLKEIETRFKVLPSFRPDKAINIFDSGFANYIKELANVSGVNIATFEDIVKALENRLQFFISKGCKVTDHGLMDVPYVEEKPTENELNIIVKQALQGNIPNAVDQIKYRYAVYQKLMEIYTKNDIVMQWHFGAIRNINSDMLKKLGPDTGYDAICDTVNVAKGMSQLLNDANLKGNVPTCIWYSLNPNDWMSILTVMGGFQKQHFGSGWWFNDTYAGMRDQITKLAEEGLLGNFIGMLTDSRSFLSFPRHEYFRRVLCEVVAELVNSGRLPENIAQKTVKAVSYSNAKQLFGF